MMRCIDIVFDGPPSHTTGRFVEVENADGASINFGEWVHRDDGYWVLRIPDHDTTNTNLEKEIKALKDHIAHHYTGAATGYIKELEANVAKQTEEIEKLKEIVAERQRRL